MATSTFDQLLNPFWHRLQRVFGSSEVSATPVNYSFYVLRLGCTILFSEPSFYHTP